jgi:hypothetical protein
MADPHAGFDDQTVLATARRLAPDPALDCQLLAPCATSDDDCRCLRLAKLALGVERDITAAWDAKADRE